MYLIWLIGSIVFYSLGVYALAAKSPVKFWNIGQQIQVNDIKKYNRAVAKLWLISAVIFDVIGLPLLAGQNSAWIVISILGAMAWAIAVMTVYTGIEKNTGYHNYGGACWLMEGIAGLVCFLLCMVPFLIMAYFGKDSKTPVSFWAGDNSLSEKVKNLAEYNAKMSKLYGRCAAAFGVNGICCLVSVPVAIGLLFIECTAGFYLVYKTYKKILESCSVIDEEE